MREEVLKRILLTIGAILMAIICLFPFIWMIVVSFAKDPTFLGSPLVEYKSTLENYVRVLSDPTLHFPAYLKNSIIIASLVTLTTVSISSLAAYAVSRIEFKGRLLIPIFVLGLSMFPQISLVGYLFKFIEKLGWVNTYQALYFPYVAWTLPLSLWILLSYFSQLPKDLDEAAMIDGASRIKTLTTIILPLSAPALFSTALLVFIAAFNEFMFALLFTTDHRARTVPVGIALFQGVHGEIPWGSVMAASVISTIPLVIMALLFQKYIVSGLTAGALKGE
ncbi:trehalose/maltose ABC transporter permease MalG [Thermococcus alcaliphilus]|uniref:trehalose/maltose ABC transporter permease MalG n=1 Tax=Thermococcus alcaliphilus TaxID=139207 RepID=UPI0020908EB8|nr:trehalose/maltose ABC transporter permease MalG [Thermococcus alcaliphilus]MCO6040252.1 carbohydrate ABC transporter permease [Thermococcus alcaliphilus]